MYVYTHARATACILQHFTHRSALIVLSNTHTALNTKGNEKYKKHASEGDHGLWTDKRIALNCL